MNGTSQDGEKKKEKKKTYTIAVKDFTSLAEFIAAKGKQAVKVPASFVTTLDRVIQARALLLYK